MSSNEWIEVKNTQSVSRVPTVTITPDKKFTFSTKMLKEFKLTQKVSVTYLVNRNDPYKIGFKFFDNVDNPEARIISGNKYSRSKGSMNTASAGSLFSKNPLLQKVAEKPDRCDRVFLVSQDLNDPNVFFITLKPEFEKSLNAEDASIINRRHKGIYRYLNSDGHIIYIGRGFIFERFSKDPNRRNWGIEKIQYSILNDDEECIKWEKFYLDKHKEEHGLLPFHNNIGGHNLNKKKEVICLK